MIKFPSWRVHMVIVICSLGILLVVYWMQQRQIRQISPPSKISLQEPGMKSADFRIISNTLAPSALMMLLQESGDLLQWQTLKESGEGESYLATLRCDYFSLLALLARIDSLYGQVLFHGLTLTQDKSTGLYVVLTLYKPPFYLAINNEVKGE